MKIPFFVLASLLTARSLLAAEPPLQPLMCVADKTVLRDDFSKAGPLKKEEWQARQGTRWAIEEGVLRGRPSTPEYQASRKDHKGLEPRVAAPITPPQFIAQFSVRFSSGTESDVAPFVEFGHHVCRLHLTSKGAELLAGSEATRVAEAKDFHLVLGQWYKVLAELQGDEFVVQIAGGPTIYAQNEVFAKPAASGANGVGVAGPVGGLAEVDDITLSSVKPGTQPGWAAKRASFQKFTPVVTKPGKGKKPAE